MYAQAEPVANFLSRSPDEFLILIADDDPNVVEVLSLLLEREGYKTVPAYDGEEALAMVRELRPDLVLLDVRMPGMDGYEVCRRIKEDPSTAVIPVVMVTMVRGLRNKLTGVEAGADDYLNKPVNEVELAARVRSLLRVKSLYDRIEAYNRELEERVAERTAQLREALDKLTEMERLRSEIINNVSHELRTPLTQVKNAVELLEGARSPDEMQALITTARQAMRRLERLVNNVMDLSAGVQTRLEPVSVRDAARRAVAELSVDGVEIRIEIEDNLPPVLADRVGLVRVLQHLLDNAIKFSPDGGPVEVIARRDGPDKVLIAVRDSGIGIPQDKLDRIFEVFYQVDGSTTRRFGGAGVGLSLVKLIVEGMGSHINVESREGEGSTFSFVLPIAEVPQ